MEWDEEKKKGKYFVLLHTCQFWISTTW